VPAGVLIHFQIKHCASSKPRGALGAGGQAESP